MLSTMWKGATDRIALSVIVLLVGVGQAVAQLPPPPDPGGPTSAEPRLHVEKRNQDLGTYYAGEDRVIVWLLENQGGSDIEIERTAASCGCTVVDLPADQQRIAPGAQLELRAKFDSTGRRDKQRKTVTIFSNDPAEPKLVLSFEADLKPPYDITPSSALMLQQMRRGDQARQTVEVFPGQPQGSVEVTGVTFTDGAPLQYTVQPVSVRGQDGQQITLQVQPDAALGLVSTGVEVALRAQVPALGGGEAGKMVTLDRVHKLVLRAEIVGDIMVTPRVIDATRRRLLRGQSLEPIRLTSTDKRPFQVLAATGGSLLDLVVTEAERSIPGTSYQITPRLREDVPTGPFGVLIELQTSSIDQPVVTVPVYGMVAPIVEVDPPIVLLQADGTPMGARRRVRLMADARERLDVTAFGSPSPRCASPSRRGPTRVGRTWRTTSWSSRRTRQPPWGPARTRPRLTCRRICPARSRSPCR